jgi:short-subunit dehydrogenase
MKTEPLKNKVLWITGASSGIGAALAKEAHRRGALLILSGRNRSALEALGTASPDRIAILSFDLADPAERLEAAGKAPEFFGRVDCLILNAGVSQRSKFIETSPAVFDRIMETNFKASVDLVRAVLPGMLERRSGTITCVSSIAGLMGAPWRTAYSASKHALGGFFSSLRAELSGSGVRITMIFPGFVQTAISQNALSGDGSRHGVLDPLQASGQDPEITARKILDALEAGKLELKVAFDAKAQLGVFLSRHFPALFSKSISRHGGL